MNLKLSVEFIWVVSITVEMVKLRILVLWNHSRDKDEKESVGYKSISRLGQDRSLIQVLGDEE